MKKAKIIVFIIMILASILPLAGVIVPLIMGKGPGIVGVIGCADGPTSVFIAGRWTPHIITTFIPSFVLFVVWLILHIKTSREN